MKLTIDERMILLEEIWEGISSEGELIELTESLEALFTGLARPNLRLNKYIDTDNLWIKI